jgi:hypothetical protein
MQIYEYFVYLQFFIILSYQSFVPSSLNLHNRLVENCGAGKEEVMLEADTKMEARTEESKDLLVCIVCKNQHEEPGKHGSAAHFFIGRGK